MAGAQGGYIGKLPAPPRANWLEASGLGLVAAPAPIVANGRSTAIALDAVLDGGEQDGGSRRASSDDGQQ
jgi:hypothetical protein